MCTSGFLMKNAVMDKLTIQGFKQLRVLTPYYPNKMDKLPQDLKEALDETPDHRLPNNKLRRNKSWKCRSKHKCSVTALGSSVPKSSAMSGDSDSSFDNQIQHQMEISTNGSHKQSDSDDVISLVNRQNYQLTSWRHCAANIGESDSVNENFHPSREPRRKRKFKRMSVDPPSVGDHEFQSMSSVPSFSLKSKRLRNLKTQKLSKLALKTPKLSKITVSQLSAEMENICRNFGNAASSCGKRKRCVHEKSIECNGCDCKELFLGKHNSEKTCVSSNLCHTMDYDVNNRSQDTCSSGLSSSESENEILTNDESREADDEQSDFFYESGIGYTECGFSGWWQDEQLVADNDMIEPIFGTLLSKHLHGMSDENNKISAVQGGREIRSGRRRLENGVKSELVSYINVPLKKEYTCCLSKVSPNDKKKRRRMPSLTSGGHGHDDCTIPLPECNLGFNMLKNMSWKPATGLGLSCGEIVSTVKASVCNDKQGLNYCKKKNDANLSAGTAAHFGLRNSS